MLRIFLGLIALVAAASAAAAAPKKWLVRGAYSAAHFEAKHLLVATVRGSFAQVRGTAMLDDEDLTRSQVNATIAASSLYSGNAQRDAWLLGKDFLSAAEYPNLSFTSSRLERTPEGKLLMTGQLTLRGTSREVTFEVDEPSRPQRDLDGRDVRAVHARTVIDRKDFGMRWQKNLPGGGVLLGDEVRIELDIELVGAH